MTNTFEPIQIFDQNNVETIDYDNLCPICYDQIKENNSYTLQECNHKFHTNCIITWLRSDHSNCPMCNGLPNEGGRFYYRNEKYKLRLILNYSRRKTASNKVIKIVNRYRKKNQEYLHVKKQLNIFKKSHKKIFKEKANITTKMWRLRRDVDKLKREITNIPIQPIIIR